MKILITGAAGFIGMNLAIRLANENHDILGIDNINSYYDTKLKYDRLKNLGINREEILYNKKIDGILNFKFIELDITDAGNLMSLFAKDNFDIVINLAAQAGVRYSITNPKDYIESNIIGFFNILESCRNFSIKHLIYASSSSVYGNSADVPFNTNQKTDEPISLYAATKKSNELMAFTYSHLYKIPTTGLRFFTVYGPWGRPDMAYYNFTKKIISGDEIGLYNNGNLFRDFTYIDDIIESISRLLDLPPLNDINKNRLLNIGNQNPILLIDFVKTLENLIKKNAIIVNMPMQAGDVNMTFADTSEIEKLTGFKPKTDIKIGLENFVSWYNKYNKYNK